MFNTIIVIVAVLNGVSATTTLTSTTTALGSYDCDDRLFSCLDCTTSQICRPTVTGELTFFKAMNCPTESPYCQFASGSCGRVPDERCGEEDDFICMGDGYYPDPVDCRVYHHCKDLISYKFNCSIPGETYNPATQQCESGLECATFDCPGRGRKTPDLHTPTYYGYCQSTENSTAVLVVDRCPSYYALNTTSQLCEPQCTRDGVIPDVASCFDYHECRTVYIAGRTVMTHILKTCPDGTAFDSVKLFCVAMADAICENTLGYTTQALALTTTGPTQSTTFALPTN